MLEKCKWGSNKTDLIPNVIQRLMNDVQRLVKDVQRLVNNVHNLVNDVHNLMNGVHRLVNDKQIGEWCTEISDVKRLFKGTEWRVRIKIIYMYGVHIIVNEAQRCSKICKMTVKWGIKGDLWCR